MSSTTYCPAIRELASLWAFWIDKQIDSKEHGLWDLEGAAYGVASFLEEVLDDLREQLS